MAMLAWRTDAVGAWKVLSRLSQDTNTNVRDLALTMADLVTDLSVDPLGPVELRAELEALRPRPADSHDAGQSE